MSELSGFTFGNLDSCEYGLVITEAPPIVIAEREVERISVAGRSGDLLIDKGRYKNVTVPYKCAIIPEGESIRDDAVFAVALLRTSACYQRLENTFQPDCFRIARVSEEISIESIMEQAGVFTVKFDCKPQRFLKTGEIPIVYESAGKLINPTTETALPQITVFGTEAGTVSIGGVTVEIKEIEDQIILDCDMQNAYRQVADSGPESQNSKIYAPEFPTLQPGINEISFTGGISKIEIIPRWWSL